MVSVEKNLLIRQPGIIVKNAELDGQIGDIFNDLQLIQVAILLKLKKIQMKGKEDIRQQKVLEFLDSIGLKIFDKIDYRY